MRVDRFGSTVFEPGTFYDGETDPGNNTPEKEPVVEPKAEPTEEMIPASRLRGLIKEKAQLEQRMVALEESLNSKKLEGMSEVERLKAEKETTEAKAKDWEDKYGELRTRLKRAAVLNHFADASTPRVADLVDLSKVELDDRGDLTKASKSVLKEWKSRDENKPLFASPRRGGNSPAPGSSVGTLSKEGYAKIINDPKRSSEEKQAAHDQYVRQLAG